MRYDIYIYIRIKPCILLLKKCSSHDKLSAYPRNNRTVQAKWTSPRLSLSTSGHQMISDSNSPYTIYFAVPTFTTGTWNGTLQTRHIWRNTRYTCKRPWFILTPVVVAYASIDSEDHHTGKWVTAIYRKSNALSLLNSAEINYLNTTLFNCSFYYKSLNITIFPIQRSLSKTTRRIYNHSVKIRWPRTHPYNAGLQWSAWKYAELAAAVLRVLWVQRRFLRLPLLLLRRRNLS